MNPEVVILTSAERGVADPPVVKLAIREADSRGWEKRVFRQRPIRDSSGKAVCLLDPDEANRLYQRAHSARLAVWTTAEVVVQLNPTRNRLDTKYLARLSRLLRYKATLQRVSPENLKQAVADYEGWLERVECSHERDPRVLPLHTFSPSADWSDLHHPEGRERFVAAHGGPARRVCEQKLSWTPDLGRHGPRDPQQVSGLELSPGYHWDVSDDTRKVRLLTLTEVWQIPPESHINVYPNGYVRPGGNAKVVATVGDRPRLPARSRKK